MHHLVGLAVLVGASLLVAGCPADIPRPPVETDGGATACEPTAASMQRMFAARCADSGCHGARMPIVDLDLVSPGLEARLVNVPARGCRPDVLVVPGSPERSLLVTKVSEAQPECGLRMPVAPPHLPSAEVDCLRRWVLALAPAPGVDAGVPADVVSHDVAGPPPTITCPPGQALCGDRCFDLQRDNTSCGACGRSCPAGTVCTAGACACAGGQTMCGGACVDTATSAAHCGGCGKACASNQTCTDGACRCNAGLTSCQGACADISADAAHCGGCGQPCARGTVCAGGTCVRGGCPTGTTSCDGACVDTQTSALHCGGCGRACAAGQRCTGGSCGCAAGSALCGGACVNTASDPLNCGGCGRSCPSGSACVNGACGCTGGLVACGGTCVNTATDSAHCGGCGRSCPAGTSCSGGSCSASCAPGTTLCGGAGCVNTSSDAAHCGGCGKACGAGETCSGGACTSCGPPVSYAGQVQPIWNSSCTTNCHGGNRPSAGLDLTPAGSYADLVNGPADCGRTLVVPRSPSTSYLLNKLTGQGMCSGTQMPARGVSLAQGQLDLIRGWICQGALKN
jgi:hypothetical protein